MRSTFREGFTILELLVVIAAVGLLVTLGALSLSSARAQLRDTQRVSDISVLRSALTQFWLDKATYPVSDGMSIGSLNAQVLTPDGFVGADSAGTTIYLPRVPSGPRANEFYKYRGNAQGYSLRFQTERNTAFGKANVYYAHASGIDTQDEIK